MRKNTDKEGAPMIIRIDCFKNIHKTFGASILDCFTRDQLRELAKEFDVPRGRNKRETINNLAINFQRINKTIRVEIY